MLEAHPADTSLRSLDVVAGDEDGLVVPGLLLGKAMRDLVGVDVGDTVEVTVQDPVGGGTLTTTHAPVAGSVQEALGTGAYASLDALDQTLGMPVPTTGALVAVVEGADGAAVQDRLEALERVASTQSSAGLRDLMEDARGCWSASSASCWCAGRCWPGR